MTLPSSSTVRIFCGATRRQRVQGSGAANGESWHRRAHKVHADCGNIALGVRIILRKAGRALASRLAEVTGSTSGHSTEKGREWASHRKTQQQARLSYARIADEQQLRGPHTGQPVCAQAERRTRRKVTTQAGLP